MVTIRNKISARETIINNALDNLKADEPTSIRVTLNDLKEVEDLLPFSLNQMLEERGMSGYTGKVNLVFFFSKDNKLHF